MSQTVVFITVGGTLHDEIWSKVPDHEECVQICRDFGFDEDIMRTDWTGSVTVEYEWIEIGNGESGTDAFLDEDLLLHIRGTYGWEEEIEKLGYTVDEVYAGSDKVCADEMQEE